MRNAVIVVAVGLMILSGASVSIADTKPIQLALFNPIQIFPEETSIGGLRLSIYGKNVSVTGIDIGLVNVSSGGTSTGLQWGVVGINDGNFVGLQSNLVSIVRGNMEGLQLAWYNQTGHAGGLQIGLLNMTDTMNGIQIGILNFIKEGGFFPFFPIVNWSFK